MNTETQSNIKESSGERIGRNLETTIASLPAGALLGVKSVYKQIRDFAESII